MSTLKVDAIVDKDSGNTTTINGQAITASNTSGRNMLINGKFTISQRYGTSAATINASAGLYTIDRWMLYTQSGNYSVQQVSEADQPDGFANACKVTVSSVGDSTSSSALAFLEQKIEGYNISSLNWGGGNTSTPKTCTLSFHVKSSVTGTYSVHFGNDSNRFYVSTYTINSANTWEKKTITLTGPTDGTWNYTTGRGLEIVFPLVAGSNYTTASLNSWISTEDYMSTSSVQWGDNAGATFYLTGVQFEEGSVATEFEHEIYAQTLSNCQRYCFVITGDDDDMTGLMGYSETTANARFPVLYPVAMRNTPSFTLSGTCRAQGGSVDGATFTSGLAILNANTNHTGAALRVTGSSGMGAADRGYNLQIKANGTKLIFSAEL